MKKIKLEQICRKEFKKIDGLYVPEDTFGVLLFNPLSKVPQFGVYYTSKRFSKELTEEEKEKGHSEGKTMIHFNVTSDEAIVLGCAQQINVRYNFRGRGFGRCMIEAMERVFKQTGKIAVYTSNIENPSFWRHIGYKLDKGVDGVFAGVKVLV